MTDPRIWQAEVDELRRAVQALGKPRYMLAATTAIYYQFVNVHSSGIAREHYTISRSEFWGVRDRRKLS